MVMFISQFPVTAIDIKQTVQVDSDLQIRAYYAGHVSSLILSSHIIFLT